MAQAQTRSLLDYIRGVLAEADADKQSDRELLHRFSADHDEIAFKAILRRHGPMVLRICQRLLDKREDAEDVFQATFLVLSRRSTALRWRESIGAWLYAVAHRLAQETRRKQFGRVVREARARPRSVEDPLSEVSGRELVAILDEELANLPERYRAPLLLHLDGTGADEAARRLGCSPSTLKRRLRRARELLQSRLARKGFALSAALSAMLLCNTARAVLPPSLVGATAQAASLLAAGETLTAGLISAQALALAGEVGRAVALSKLKLAMVILSVAGGLVAGTMALSRHTPPEPQGEVAAPQPRLSMPPVAATIETTLATAPYQIRQLAFDGDLDTYFASNRNAGPGDHFTLVLDRPVAIRSLAVLTGRPAKKVADLFSTGLQEALRASASRSTNDLTPSWDRLDAGSLEVSEDGQHFEILARFNDGMASVQPHGRFLRAVRLRPTADLGHALAIREIAVDSDPPVSIFKYPVEFAMDVTEAPEMSAWAEKVVRICERTYPLIHEELKAEAFRPAQVIKITLKKDFQGIAAVDNGRITGSVNYFKQHPDDVGAIVYTTVFCVQDYCHWANSSRLREEIADQLRFCIADPRSDRSANSIHPHLNANFQALMALLLYLTEKRDHSPDWLARGIADYFRFFKYEPGSLGPFNPGKGEYANQSRTTAAFLAYLTKKYDQEIVPKLNRILRDGKYKEDVFRALTGKPLSALDEEWRTSLRHGPGL
jgi:RNA polymerase sigma factor (sigma-70 family)